MTVGPEPAVDASTSGLISRSHLGIEPFALVRPASLADAAAGVADGAWAHAGGIDVAQRLRHGESTESVVPLGGLEALTEISLRDGALFIGAAVTHARIESNALVRSRRPDLAAAWRTIGNVRIRTAGTVGGNLMALDAGYDAAPILAAAGAELIFLEPDGSEQRCSVADRVEGRLLVGCEVPLEGRVVYDRSLKPVASVAVGDRYAAIGCAYSDVKVIELEVGTNGVADLEAVRAGLDALGEPLDDANASSRYRSRVIAVLMERCVQAHAEDGSASLGYEDRVPSSADAPWRASAAPAGLPGQVASQRVDGGSAGDADSVNLQLHLNGEPFATTAPVSEMLVETIRTRAGLGATRVGCDQAVCGACTVLVDGLPTASCSTFAWQAAGCEVHTIEAANNSPGPEAAGRLPAVMREVQRTFADTSAFQCGYCTPGLILTASSLLAHHQEPDRGTIADWLDSNVCRCTGYLMVIEAVEAAGAALRSRGDLHREPST
ncbi:FAD binding domain-containing protein [Candidatus Poriferisodalis sp.]|uniref:FAD binding domain-containing protein n=1 Tax=Candidatus Poriferisodalis sp. TaxID=3101277 RepID=UPI003B029EB6